MSAVMDPAMQGMPPPGAEEAADPAAEQQFETILAGLIEFIFGKGRAGIEKQLKGAKDLPQTIGEIAFALLKEAGDQAKKAQQEIDMEVMFGIATEVIDSLIRMAGKLKLKVGNVDEMREQAMMTAINAYVMTTQHDPEQQEIAQALLAEFAGDGSLDQAAAEVMRIGQRAGVDPFAAAEQSGAPAPTQGPPQGAGMMGA